MTSHFQLCYFVIGKEPTNQAKMHRCLEEIKDRQNTISGIEMEIEELNDVIELYRIDIKKKSLLDTEEKEIRIRQVQRKIKSNLNHVESLKEKIKIWESEIKFLNEMLEQISKKTSLRNWNDYDVQLEYWSEKMAQEIRQRLILNAPVDIEVIKTTLSLPDSAPIKQQLLEHVKALKEK